MASAGGGDRGLAAALLRRQLRGELACLVWM